MINSKIMSVGKYLGEYEVSTAALLDDAGIERFEVPRTRIQSDLGISHVRHCSSQTKPGDVAIAACEQALAQFREPLSEIDAVIYCGMKRDTMEPSTAHRVADELGISANFCPDIADACHGFTAGMILADALIKSGQYRYVLVTTGETPSKGTYHIAERFQRNELGKDDVENNLGAFTVGDAGGAMILGPTDDGTGIQLINTNSDSRVRNACYVDWETNSFAMHMLWISRATIKLVGRMAPQTLQKIGWANAEVGRFIAHQVGKRVQDSYLKILKMERERSIETYEHFGNLTSATIPVCWDILQNRGLLPRGEKVFVNSTGSGIVVSQMGYIV